MSDTDPTLQELIYELPVNALCVQEYQELEIKAQVYDRFREERDTFKLVSMIMIGACFLLVGIVFTLASQLS